MLTLLTFASCLSALVLMPSAPPRVPAALFGPPAVCHPIAIGNARSLPWKEGAFAPDPKYDTTHLVDDALALLDGSGDTFVHMETVRRAVVYLTGEGPYGEGHAAGARSSDRSADAARLLQALSARAQSEEQLRASAPAAAPHGTFVAPAASAAAILPPGPMGGPACARAASGCDAGLCWFDFGYAGAAFTQMGIDVEKLLPAAKAAHPPGMTGGSDNAVRTVDLLHAALERGATLRPQDGALHLGIALALFGGESRDEAASLDHLDKALALADDPQGLLRTNLLGTMGKFLGARTHEDLVAAVRERKARG